MFSDPGLGGVFMLELRGRVPLTGGGRRPWSSRKRASLRMAFFFLAKPNTGNKFEFVSEFRIFVVTPDHGVPSYTHQIFWSVS